MHNGSIDCRKGASVWIQNETTRKSGILWCSLTVQFASAFDISRAKVFCFFSRKQNAREIMQKPFAEFRIPLSENCRAAYPYFCRLRKKTVT